MHGSSPKVSVVLPFYNAEKTLSVALQSIADQKFSDWECVMVDNNSSDGIFITDSEQNIANFPRFKVEHVIDGDTVIVSTLWSKLRIRLDSIDCPEDGQEWGEIATAGLIKLIGGKHVHLEDHGTDRYERRVATLYVPHNNDSGWMNVNERMVTLGHAWVMRKYYKHLPKHRQDKLNQLERWAKSKKVGLWKAKNPVPP